MVFLEWRLVHLIRMKVLGRDLQGNLNNATHHCDNHCMHASLLKRRRSRDLEPVVLLEVVISMLGYIMPDYSPRLDFCSWLGYHVF